MNQTLLQQLIGWPNCFISGTELKAILPGSDDARKSILKRAIQEGYLQRLKRDYYLINQIPNKPLANLFELAQFIYGPSYISFESTLSYYGWIPERVTVTCSAAIKQSKSFDTPIGEFSFEKIPNTAFKLGVYQTIEEKARYLIADPWKAIADLIYCRKKTWSSAEDVMTDLRIEEDIFRHHNTKLLADLCESYPHRFTRKILKVILKDITK